MNQAIYQDACSKCQRPCTRVRRQQPSSGATYWVTSCCSAPPMAVKKGT